MMLPLPWPLPEGLREEILRKGFATMQGTANVDDQHVDSVLAARLLNTLEAVLEAAQKEPSP